MEFRIASYLPTIDLLTQLVMKGRGTRLLHLMQFLGMSNKKGTCMVKIKASFKNKSLVNFAHLKFFLVSKMDA